MTVGLSASMLLQWYRFMPTQSELSLIIHSWTISQFDFCNIRLPSSATALLCHEMISVTVEISLTQIQQASWRLRAWGNFVFIPLSVSMHINHFTFIHLHFHNMLVIVTIISAFPPFLVSSFIALISAPSPPHHLCVIHSPFPFLLFSMHHIFFHLISFTRPMPSLPLRHPGKSLFHCRLMAMKHLSPSETSPLEVPPKIVLQRLLHKLFALSYVSP